MGEERWVQTQDGAMLWVAVDGDGPPVLLCHGGPGLWDYLGGLAELLSDRFTVHRWDQRGCGRSGPAEPYGLDTALSDVQDLKAALGVDGPWSVVGHSWGAYLALLTAIEHPETTAGLVSISGTGTPAWWREVGSAIYRANRAGGLDPSTRDRLAALESSDRDTDEEVEFRRLAWATDFVNRTAPPAALEQMTAFPYPINWEQNRRLSRAKLHSDDELLDACRRCPVPSLFIHGTEDPRPDAGARQLSALVPGAHFAPIGGAGHLPWVERPHEVADAIIDFLLGPR